MAKKNELRRLHEGTVINGTSKRQEQDVIIALKKVETKINKTFPTISLKHDTQIFLKHIIDSLRVQFPDIEFASPIDTSSMRPDGGILSIVDNSGKSYPILISEVKNQGTNDIRKIEGKKEQAKGNAIERLGKNVIGFRTFLLPENIFPFVCFGYGCDFDKGSSILDRVTTMAMFGKLNTVNLHNTNNFNRGSFYFRKKQWTVAEMTRVMFDIAKKSVHYYFSKYGEEIYLPTTD